MSDMLYGQSAIKCPAHCNCNRYTKKLPPPWYMDWREPSVSAYTSVLYTRILFIHPYLYIRIYTSVYCLLLPVLFSCHASFAGITTRQPAAVSVFRVCFRLLCCRVCGMPVYRPSACRLPGILLFTCRMAVHSLCPRLRLILYYDQLL